MSRKDFNKGTELGLQVASSIIKKETEALDYVKTKIDEMSEGQEEIGNAVMELIDDVNADSIKKVFKVSNPIMPSELKEYEKMILLNILGTLSVNSNEKQKEFFNNLRHHLNLTGYNIDIDYDFRAIDNLENVKAIKTIAKAVRVFLFLMSSNFDGVYMHEYDLFSHFEIRSFDEIDSEIELIHYLFGDDGLIEMYGYFDEDEEDCSSMESKSYPDETIEFYNREIVIVYKDSYSDEAQYLLNILTENRKAVQDFLVSNICPCKCNMSEYQRKRQQFEEDGKYLIFLGDTNESKAIYKHANGGRWDYRHLGMRYVSEGNNTVILARKLKNQEIDSLINLAVEENKKYKIQIPEDVETVKYRSLIKVLYDEGLKGEDTVVKIVNGVAGAVLSPLILLGEGIGAAKAGIQGLQNNSARNDLKFLQCTLAFYKYLESVGALVKDEE